MPLVEPFAGDEVIELESRREPRLVRALEMVAPGTSVREGIDNIVRGRTGALICIGDSEELSFLYSGGIKLDVDFTPAMLWQLGQMDGAIILSSNTMRVTWANVQLMPDPTILSLETAPATGPPSECADRRPGGSGLPEPRHRVALPRRREESSRTSRPCSPRPTRPWPRSTSTAAAWTRCPPASPRSSSRAVSLNDVLTVLQRSELVTRMAVEIERYIVELERGRRSRCSWRRRW